MSFSEAVDVTGRPYVVLNVGGAARRAVYAAGTGTANLDFAYTVQASDFDADGLSLCSSTLFDPGCGRIQLDGGSILARFDDRPAPLALPAQGDQSGHKVDGTPPGTFVPPLMPTGPTADPGMGIVPPGWALKPDAIGRGEMFRLLFITTTKRDATSSDIGVYNSFVEVHASEGHEAIRAYSAGFRVLASTQAVDARDNTATTGTGVPIYWLNGNKLADDYADLYDGSWDDEANPRDQNGSPDSDRSIWSGSKNDGTKARDSGGFRALGQLFCRKGRFEQLFRRPA